MGPAHGWVHAQMSLPTPCWWIINDLLHSLLAYEEMTREHELGLQYSVLCTFKSVNCVHNASGAGVLLAFFQDHIFSPIQWGELAEDATILFSW